MLDDNNDINNAFARVCLHKMLPAIDYIAANGYLLMSEQLAKWGITDRVDSPVPLPALGEPVVRRPFYEIHVVDDHAYIRFLARVARPACPSLE